MAKSQELYKKAKRLIPGGTQLLTKRPEMHLPGLWPAYYSKAKGCEVWDLDGNKYTDMSYMGIGSCILGYADKDVNLAVKRAIDGGSMSTLNAPEEVELAETLLRIHPWADMARYARSGGEAMSIAVRIARAATRMRGSVGSTSNRNVRTPALRYHAPAAPIASPAARTCSTARRRCSRPAGSNS